MGKIRIEWLDGARGIAIFLVVLGQVLRGLRENAGRLGEWAAFLDGWIYSFHMTALNGGYFAGGALEGVELLGSHKRNRRATFLAMEGFSALWRPVGS